MFKHKRRLSKILLLTALLALAIIPATVHAQGVTQSYTSDETIRRGMIVRLKDNDGTKIETLDQQHERDMLGVVVVQGDTPVALTTPGATSAQNFVATTGRFDVLVSSQNGPIKIGDFVTISALNGVGMKIDGNHQIVIGKALEAFDGKTNVDGRASLDRGLIGKQQVTLGVVQVDISVAHNPFYEDPTIDGVPKFLSRAVHLITDKKVSAVRIYASLLIVMLCLAVAGVIIYSGVRNGMVAVGRNPLARKTIMRNLLQVVIVSLIVFTIGLIAVYLLLRL